MLVLSHVTLFVTPWTVARQPPLSMEFSRQEYWSGLPLPSPGDIPDPGTEPWSLRFFTIMMVAGVLFIYLVYFAHWWIPRTDSGHRSCSMLISMTTSKWITKRMHEWIHCPVIMLNPRAATGQQFPFLLNIRITSIGCERCAPIAPARIFWIKTSRYGIWDNSFLINTPGSSHVISFTPVHRLEFLNYQGGHRAGCALSAGAKLWPGASESMYPFLPEKKKGREIVLSKGYLCWGGWGGPEIGYKEWILWSQWHRCLNSDSSSVIH